jgi:hypothetical protein
VANTATGIVLVAGTMTFANEWYQTGKVNWRVPVATLLLAAGFDALAHIDDKAAIGLSIMVLIGAATAKFGGASVADTLAQIFGQQKPTKKQTKRQRHLAVA